MVPRGGSRDPFVLTSHDPHPPPMNRSDLLLPLLLVPSLACAAAGVDPAPEQDRLSWSQRLPDPVSAGTTFESPVIETAVEAHAVHQTFPDDSIFGGGDFQLYALQARFAINERWSLIATKDGYIDLNPDAGSDESGLADIAGGVKVVAHADEEAGVLVTAGVIYETTSGDDEVFQGNGDGLIRPFVSAGWDAGRTKVLGAAGYNWPLDDEEESASYDYHLHLSYEVTPAFLPLIEVNGITYTSDGEALPVSFEGGDLINLGAADVAGNTVISGALGGIWNVSDRVQLGLTYEWPWTSREDLLDERIWLAALFRF